MNWFPVELHCHTTHSDGTFTPAELVRQAKAFGLAGIALTDHNTAAGWEETLSCAGEQGLCVLPGVEWTTYYGHMLVLRRKDCADWMNLRPDNIDEATAAILADGGTIGAAHPFRPGNPVGTGCCWEFSVRRWENFRYYEVLSGADPTLQAINRKALETWTSLLDRGFRLTPTSGIDWHAPLKDGTTYACTYVGASGGDLTAGDMNAAVAFGRTSLTIGPLLTMTADQGDRRYPVGSVCPKGGYTFSLRLDPQRRATYWNRLGLLPGEWRLVTSGGRILFQSPYRENECEISSALEVRTSWCRAELWGNVRGRESLIALTAPIYFVKES